MKDLLEQLRLLLEEQQQIQQQLLDLSHEKKRVIIENKTERLGEIVQLELRQLAALNALEKRRLKLLLQLSPFCGVPVSDLTVGMLIERAEEQQREPLRRLQRLLVAMLREQTALNSEIKDLLEAHLEYSEVMLNLMVDSQDPLNNLYSGTGRAEDDIKIGTALFDQKT